MTKDNFTKTEWLSVDIKGIIDIGLANLYDELSTMEDFDWIHYEVYPTYETGAKNEYIKLKINPDNYNEVMKRIKHSAGYRAVKILSGKPAFIKK